MPKAVAVHAGPDLLGDPVDHVILQVFGNTTDHGHPQGRQDQDPGRLKKILVGPRLKPSLLGSNRDSVDDFLED